MSNDVTQWLAQIKALKQQLAETISDRDTAYESADNWRQLYNTEAQQRRTEARLTQQQVEALKAEIRQRQGESSQLKADDPEAASAIEQELAKMQTVEELRTKLKDIMGERDRLLNALKTEQTNHAQTRKSLTTVIGDTIDQLSKERGNHSATQASQALKN
jgi:DNA repair exonuclease SbcCD ATPase subunit